MTIFLWVIIFTAVIFNLWFILKFRKSGYRCLLASEVVQLLCIVPVFFDFIGKDPGKEYFSGDSIISKLSYLISMPRNGALYF